MPHEPKKRHSKAAKRVRRASIRLLSPSLIVCKNCHQKTPAHIVCRSCGFYAGAEAAVNRKSVTVTKA